MKVLLVGNYPYDRQESMLRFSSLMEQGLRQEGHEVRMCGPPPVAGRLRPSEQGAGKWLGYLDKFAVLPPLLKKAARWADVVHICDHSNSMYVRCLAGRPHVVTCHDMLGIREGLSRRARWTGRQLQRMVLRGLQRAQHVACVSDATRSDLLQLTGIPENRVSRIYNGLNYPYAPMPASEARSRLRAFGLGLEKPFVLHIGGNSWYKNREGVLRIFKELHRRTGENAPHLVMAGKPWTATMKTYVSEVGLGRLTTELVGVSNEDLRALYSAARVMLFPSREEGFGWPILEAQACGCAVVTTNRSPMNEVGGAAAVYVDPDDLEGAAATLAAVISTAEERRQPSLENARRFSTARMLQSYIDLYSKVLYEHS
jgi:glycosyltransferase involved in cell wall biosynthesis